MYENTIQENYASVASAEGHLESCTMHDEAHSNSPKHNFYLMR
jgi:hypothetical protein